MADFEWVNNGSIKDVSGLAAKSLAVTSQAGGNMMSSNHLAMTAPGSEPVDPLPDRREQGDPEITMSGPEIPVGTSGKPQARGSGSQVPAAPAWKKTTVPDVVREA